MKASEVATAVRRRYGCERPTVGDGMPPEWAALEEFLLSPPTKIGYRVPARIDMLIVRAWGGKPKGHERHAIEIKVDRADLRNELAQPSKRRPAQAVAHRFYFATPAGLFDGLEIPDDCGLLEVTDRGVRETRRAPRNDDPEPVDERTFVEAFRRASRAEARTRVVDTDDLPARLVAAEADVKRMEGQVLRANTARDLEKKRTTALLRVVAADRVVPCRCGQPLVPARGGKRTYYYESALRWHHKPGVADDCTNLNGPDWDAYARQLFPDDPEPGDD